MQGRVVTNLRGDVSFTYSFLCTAVRIELPTLAEFGGTELNHIILYPREGQICPGIVLQRTFNCKIIITTLWCASAKNLYYDLCLSRIKCFSQVLSSFIVYTGILRIGNGGRI